MSWSNVSSWSASSRLLLIGFSLISKTPSWRQFIMLISNSDGAYFPVILLFFWLVEVEVEVVLEVCLKMIAILLPRLVKPLSLEADLENQQHLNPSPESQTWLDSFAEERPSERDPERLFSHMKFLIVHWWLVSSNLELLELRKTLNSSSLTNLVTARVLRIWPPERLTMCVPAMTSSPNHSAYDFFGWGTNPHRREQWVIHEPFWRHSHRKSSHLIWPDTDWSDRLRAEWSMAWKGLPLGLSQSPILMALAWPQRVLWNLSTVPWLWWEYGGLTWVEWPSHWRTDFAKPFTATNCLRALIATCFAAKIWNYDCSWHWDDCLHECEDIEVDDHAPLDSCGMNGAAESHSLSSEICLCDSAADLLLLTYWAPWTKWHVSQWMCFFYAALTDSGALRH